MFVSPSMAILGSAVPYAVAVHDDSAKATGPVTVGEQAAGAVGVVVVVIPVEVVVTVVAVHDERYKLISSILHHDAKKIN